MGGIRVESLHVYPVKSARGIALESAAIEERGFEHDRRWMVVDARGRFVSQREEPRLALLAVAVEASELVLSTPGMPVLRVPLAPRGARRPVRIWDDPCEAVSVGPEAAAWLGDLFGAPSDLVYMPDDVRRPRPVGFADAYPFLLLSTASLDDLNRRLERPLPMNRFRPNIVVSGCAAFAEDAWRRIAIGGIPFAVAKPCARCAITTIDQETGERGVEPLRTLAAFRRVGTEVMFGQNLLHEGRGVVRVGDAVEVLNGS
jgi:hypothetical protein